MRLWRKLGESRFVNLKRGRSAALCTDMSQEGRAGSKKVSAFVLLVLMRKVHRCTIIPKVVDETKIIRGFQFVVMPSEICTGPITLLM